MTKSKADRIKDLNQALGQLLIEQQIFIEAGNDDQVDRIESRIEKMRAEIKLAEISAG